jgi:autotransporter adhesin
VTGSTDSGYPSFAAGHGNSVGQTAVPGQNAAGPLNLRAIGSNNTVNGENSTVIGSGSEAIGLRTTAIGVNARTGRDGGALIGASATTPEADQRDVFMNMLDSANAASVDIFSDTTLNDIFSNENIASSSSPTRNNSDDRNLSGNNNFAAGQQVNVYGENSAGIGSNVGVIGNASTAIGSSAFTLGYESFAVGSSARVTGDQSSAFGTDATVLGHRSTAIGYDATSTQSNQIVLGGATNSSIIANGVYNNTTQAGDNIVTIGQSGELHSSSPTAFAGAIANNLTVVGSAGTAVSGGVSIQPSSIGTQDIAPGAVTFDRLDAGVQNRITGLETGLRTANAGVSMAFAMSNLPQLSNPDSDGIFGIAVGTFEDETSLAMGGTARLNNNTLMRGSLAYSNDTFGAGVGIGWEF